MRRCAAAVLAAALRAADPARLIHESLKLRGRRLSIAGRDLPLGKGRLVMIAAGKAAGSMARAAEDVLGAHLDEGLAVDTSATGPLSRVRLLLAGHPVPDRRGLVAAQEVERLAGGLGHNDMLLVLLSGGASALLPAPVPGISLADKARATLALMRAGASIRELNALRKHLSRLKGGGLARLAAPARLVCLALSDVVGDELSTIASGPTVGDPTTYAEALAAAELRGVTLPWSVRRHLQAGSEGERPETPKPGSKVFRGTLTHVIGSNRLAVEAAARESRRQGLRPLVLTTRLEGEAREVGRVLAGVLGECVDHGRPARPPVCLVAGGETTVTVKGSGRGGRNQELVVAAMEPLSRSARPVVMASLATDGIDGNSEAAGGVADDRSLHRARKRGLAPPAAFLAHNDTNGLLAGLGDLIVTGPTGTNVVDVTVLLAGTGRS